MTPFVFIKVTSSSTGNRVLVNVGNITSITRYERFTDIQTTAGDSGLEVVEQPAEILELIKEATSPVSILYTNHEMD